MKELLDTHKELELHEQVLKSMHQAVARGEGVVRTFPAVVFIARF